MAANNELKKHLEATQLEISQFTLRLQRFFATNLKPIVARIKADSSTTADAAQMLGGLRQALIDAGLEREIIELEKPYARQLDYIKSQYQALDIKDPFADVDINVVQQLIDFDLDRVATNIDALIGDTRSVLMSTVLGGNTDALDAITEDLSDKAIANIETELNTMTQGFSRAVTADVGEQLGFSSWEYIGPDDNITRPFCAEVLGAQNATYSTEEIAAMDNGQGLDVMTFGGGYNCRHQWRPVE